MFVSITRTTRTSLTKPEILVLVREPFRVRTSMYSIPELREEKTSPRLDAQEPGEL